MSMQPPQGMIERAKRILLRPAEEWGVIDSEPATTGSVLTGWVLPLAAIGPVAGLIGGLVFGYSAFGATYRPSVTSAVTTAVVGYVMAIVGVFLLAKIIDALAPSFGGTRNGVQAMKVAAYGGTASYLAGVFHIIPALSILAIVGLYSLYLLYLGLPRLMKAPAEKAMSYTVVTVLAAVVLFIVAGAVTTALAGTLAPRAATLDNAGGTVSIPGVGSVDIGKMEEAARKMEAAAERSKTAKPVDRVALAALLPATAGSWTRTSVESSSATAGGLGGSQAEAAYSSGDSNVRLKIVDLSAAGALAAMASAFKVETSREDADGYQKSGMVDGRYTMEKWNNSGSGSYGVLLGERFMIEAQGDAPDIGALKALVGTVDPAALERLAQ